MNKIINIHLAGRSIPIDEQAYFLLKGYLDKLDSFFSKENDGHEILRDMEDRIGEIFQGRLKKGGPCITIEDVQDMIGVMGSPEQIEAATGDEDGNHKRSDDAHGHNTMFGAGNKEQRRLYRSRKNHVFGGVCGGIANYFNIDPILPRIGMVLITLAWGMGLVVYLLLWALLPQNDQEPLVLKKRMFRNPDQKVIGGVCSGIASYANIDPIIPRLIFLAPVFGGVLYPFNFDWGLGRVFLGAFPTFLLLYIILWISLPKADTLADKLEMQGKKVDLQSLSNAMKAEKEHLEKPKGASSLSKVISVIIKVCLFIALAFILIVLTCILIAFIATFFGLAATSFFAIPIASIFVEDNWQKWVLGISIALLIILPFIAAVRLLIRLVAGRPLKSAKWIPITSTILFIAAIFGLFWVTGSTFLEFKHRHKYTEEMPLNPIKGDTLYLKAIDSESEAYNIISGKSFPFGNFHPFYDENEGRFFIQDLGIKSSPSRDGLFHLKITKSAWGKEKVGQEQALQNIKWDHYQQGDTLFLATGFFLEQRPYRGQSIRAEVSVPAGKHLSSEDLRINGKKLRKAKHHWHYEEVRAYENDADIPGYQE